MSSNTSQSSTTGKVAEVRNGFEIPKWSGKPPSGLHLDVMKDEKMIQKLMIDEKNVYFFGRNKDQCEFVIDHASCSRVHAVLLWHKHLNRAFLIDLGSTHGTFIGSIRLEHNKPQQVFIDTEFKFGASTRTYILRERPQMNKHFPSILTASSTSNPNNSNNLDLSNETDEKNESIGNLSMSNLPESEAELENLTEFNTAHNKRIAQLVDINATDTGVAAPVQVRRKKKSVIFIEDVEIINPEDIDPSIGRFRNMISTSIVIPNKKKRPNQQYPFDQRSKMSIDAEKRFRMSDKLHDSSNFSAEDQSFTLFDDDEFDEMAEFGMSSTIASNLGIKKLELAPDVDTYSPTNPITITTSAFSSESSAEQLLLKKQMQSSLNKQSQQQQDAVSQFDKKKKYVKEAWPGRESGPTQPKLSLSPRGDDYKPRRSLSPINNVRHMPSGANFLHDKAQSPPTTGANQPPPKRLII